MRHVYYNEIDPFCAQWLRNLMVAGHIPKGDVDERDIKEVTNADVKGYVQCHFFAGIGGWAYAARLAGWPDDRPMWTGSCPCQPFSAAGKRQGTADARHLWPEMQRLVGECKPAIVFGEQVASSDGRKWLNGVRADLEDLGYAVGAADLCAASVGAPHIRQRLFWVAHTSSERRQQDTGSAFSDETAHGRESHANNFIAGNGTDGAAGRLVNATSEQVGISGQPREQRDAEGNNQRRERESRESDGQQGAIRGPSSWSNFDIVHCADGKARRIESGTFPLAHGVPARVGKLRAYGNAIVPQVAAQIIRAML